MSRLSERLKAWRERSIKSKKTSPASLTSSSPIQGAHKTSFMDLPAEIRDEIYLLCFKTNPVLHFARPQSPAESRIKKLISSRTSKTPSTTNHGLLLLNRVVSEGYKNVADRAADPVFHVTTFLDEQEHMGGKAYWVTRPRMKEWLTSCRFHIDFDQCKDLELYHVQQDIKSDFASFIWEYENLKCVTLTIDCSAGCKSGVACLGKVFETIKNSMLVPLLQHRPLETLYVRNGTAVQMHTRVEDRNGWWVKDWHCVHPVTEDIYICSPECAQVVARKTWYCEDLHHLRESPCNEKCEEHLHKLRADEALSGRLLDVPRSG